jgi:hypothetical protein
MLCFVKRSANILLLGVQGVWLAGIAVAMVFLPSGILAQQTEPTFRLKSAVFEVSDLAELSVSGFVECAGQEVQLGFYESQPAGAGFVAFTRTMVDSAGGAHATLDLDKPGIFYPVVGGSCAAERAGHQFECDCYLFLHIITVVPEPPATGTGLAPGGGSEPALFLAIATASVAVVLVACWKLSRTE